MDEELEAEMPSRAPDAETDNDDVPEFPDPVNNQEITPPNIVEVLNSLKLAQHYVLGNKLFGLADQLITGIQNMKVQDEVSSKNNQQ